MDICCACCNKSLPHFTQAVTVCSGGQLYLFCSFGCRDRYGFRKLTKRVCAREACTNRVPEGNRMLCSDCHRRGKHVAEAEVLFNKAERADWEKMERNLHSRIEGNVRIYSSQDMTQEELRALVPSLQEKAA